MSAGIAAGCAPRAISANEEGYRKSGRAAGGNAATLRRMATDYELSELVSQVARWALGAKHRIVTAESCTGGWIAKVFTDVVGSSRWFECGYVTYSDAAKVHDLGVSARTIKEHGAVSEATVREMAAGALRVALADGQRATGADISIAVSGIAGPDGGSAEKPVGTVWFCVGRRRGGVGAAAGSGPTGRATAGTGGCVSAADLADGPNAAAGPGIELLAEGQLFGGNREAVRRLSVEHALKLVLRLDAGNAG
jgi:nicotinamide-nucleotide amidase